MWKKIKPYVISVALALGVGGLSALLTAGNMDLYSEIVKPPLAPPPWLFPVVWTILYILMGISSAMVFTSDAPKRDINNALTVYGINLFLNFFWSIIFFNMRAYLFAFIWLIALWVTIIVMIIKFIKIKPVAGYLQIPYLLWVTFAGYLTLAIYILN
ncbi:MAG: tryptophan-rich sensory protein [Ruminococcaceae bacterium]|nr:tryptophan-rich sensory protein [Oscillospiraceae bacterium]